MWYSLKYDLEKHDIRPHIVESDLISWHNKYIVDNYAAAPNKVDSLKEVYLDPGGLVLAGRDPYQYTLDDGTIICVKKEHVWSIIDYFFNKESYSLAESYKDGKIHPELNIRVIDNSIVKVYLDYYVIVLKKETYLYICDMIEDKYTESVTDYLNLLTASFGIGKEEELIAYASTIEPAEA
tara:strand:- start:153 stop:695 length:543 start_codon:yes stop_codon:yes gene_type:complete